MSSGEPSDFYRVDLALGALSTRDNLRACLITEPLARALLRTAKDAPDALRDLGRAIAVHVTDGNLLAQNPGVAVTQLADALARFGWGRLALERHREAFVLHVTNCPALPAASTSFALVLEGMLTKLTPIPLGVVAVGQTDRFLVLAPDVARALSATVEPGTTLAELTERLH